MTYLTSVVLVALAAVLVIVGAATVSIVLYVAAAICSAAAMVVLLKRFRDGREHVYVTDAPATREPQWDRPIPRSNAVERPEGLEVPELNIANYDDLVAAEVLPTLETLSVDELQAVILHERHGMGRQSILRRAETLIDLTLGTGSADRMLAKAAAPAPSTVEPHHHAQHPEGPELTL